MATEERTPDATWLRYRVNYTYEGSGTLKAWFDFWGPPEEFADIMSDIFARWKVYEMHIDGPKPFNHPKLTELEPS